LEGEGVRTHYTGSNLNRAITIEDLRRRAIGRLPQFSREYLEGGSEDEVSLRRNRDVFERIAWMPKTLTGVEAPDLSTEIMGQACNMPVIIAPTGFNGLLWPEGDLLLAKAAAEAGIIFTLSTVSNYDLRKIVQQVPKERVWFQLYPIRSAKIVNQVIDRAAECGCGSLVVTSDVPVYGAREWDARNYREPMKLSLSNLLDVIAHPTWLRQVMLPKGPPEFANLVDFLPPGQASAMQGAKFMSTQINPGLSWAHISEMRRRWQGDLVLKGLLCLEDVRRAHELGANGVVLSNHGGRQLDGAISGLEILPSVVAEFGDKMTILVDGGFRRGSDVAKAMALGAHGVMIGRATLYGLAAAGQPGVTRALQILRGEMERALTLVGAANIRELDRRLIWS
jgi:(S)-mandelate dehydrogenase